jgi:hypothetical protein
MQVKGIPVGLLMRDDVYVTSIPSGAWVLAHHGSVLIEDPSAARWIDVIRPLLDGRHTLESVTGALPASQRPPAERIIRSLRDAGMITDRGQDIPPDPDTTGLTEYGAEIGFIGYFRSSAARAFASFRRGDCQVIGSGELAAACAQACLTAGIEEVRTSPLIPGDAVTPGDPLAAPAGIVIDASGIGRPRWSPSPAAVVTAVARLPDGGVWLAPVRPAPAEVPDWRDVMLRQAALAPREPDRDQAAGADQVTGADRVTQDLAAAQLVQAVFRQVALGDAGDTRLFTRVDPLTLATSRHPVLRFPGNWPQEHLTEDAFTAAIGQLRDAPRMSAEELRAAVAACTDPRTGLFAHLGEAACSQLPLHVFEAVVGDPSGLPGPGGAAAPITVAGSGWTADDAWQDASLAAFALYASLAFDPRRHAGSCPDDAGDREQPSADQRCRRRSGRSWALDLGTGRTTMVDSSDVYPLLRHGSAVCDRLRPTAPGVAAGLDWTQAVARGLAAHCRDQALARITRASRPFLEVDLDTAPLTTLGATFLSVLDVPVRTFDLTPTTGVPTFYFTCGADERGVACTAGRSAADAISDGLRQVLLIRQAEAHNEPAYLPRAVRQLPPSARGKRHRRHAWPDRELSVADLVQALHRLRLSAAVALLDHDTQAHHLLPCTVNVVISHD